ncbi:9251_t:CDS:10, partial [Entrophospora sp. SA101]
MKMHYYPLASLTTDDSLKQFKYTVFEDFVIRTFVDENVKYSVVVEYFSVDRNSQQLSWLKHGETKISLPYERFNFNFVVISLFTTSDIEFAINSPYLLISDSNKTYFQLHQIGNEAEYWEIQLENSELSPKKSFYGNIIFVYHDISTNHSDIFDSFEANYNTYIVLWQPKLSCNDKYILELSTKHVYGFTLPHNHYDDLYKSLSVIYSPLFNDYIKACLFESPDKSESTFLPTIPECYLRIMTCLSFSDEITNEEIVWLGTSQNQVICFKNNNNQQYISPKWCVDVISVPKKITEVKINVSTINTDFIALIIQLENDNLIIMNSENGMILHEFFGDQTLIIGEFSKIGYNDLLLVPQTSSNHSLSWKIIDIQDHDSQTDFSKILTNEVNISHLRALLESLITRDYDGNSRNRKSEELIDKKYKILENSDLMIHEFNDLFLPHCNQPSKNKKYPRKFISGLIPLIQKTPINQEDAKEDFIGQSEENLLEIKEAKLCFGSTKNNDKVLLKIVIENKNMKSIFSIHIYVYLKNQLGHSVSSIKSCSSLIHKLHPGHQGNLISLIDLPIDFITSSSEIGAHVCYQLEDNNVENLLCVEKIVTSDKFNEDGNVSFIYLDKKSQEFQSKDLDCSIKLINSYDNNDIIFDDHGFENSSQIPILMSLAIIEKTIDRTLAVRDKHTLPLYNDDDDEIFDNLLSDNNNEFELGWFVNEELKISSSVADIESGKSQEYTLTKSSGSGSGKLSYVTEDLVFVLLLLLRSEEADEDRLRDLRNSTLVKVCVVSVKFPLLVLAEEVTSEISEFTTQHSTKPLPTTSNIKEHDLLNDDKANAEELFHRAWSLLRSLKISPFKKTSTDNDSDLDVLNLIYKYFLRAVYYVLGIPTSVMEVSDIGKRPVPEIKNLKLLKAIELLKKAAFEYRHDDALYTLGDMNFYAKYTHPRNLTAAFNYFRDLAIKSGNSTAQQMIGFMYATGIGDVIQRDPAKATLYYTFAALGRDTAAEMTLAYRHLMGIGVERSCEDSVFYYKRVADKAVEYYKSGPPGGRQLPPTKIRLYDEDGGVYGYGASGSGAGSSASKLSDQGAWDDVLEYYRYMADKGLGNLFYQGTRSIPQNFKRALKYLKLVANQHWTSETSDEPPPTNPQFAQVVGQAAGILGQMYWRGEGVEQNTRTAIKWFQRGVSLSNPAALNGMGMMYMEGVEVNKNYDMAMTYLKHAADLDYPDAQVNLVQKNELQSAFECFKQAANQAYHLLAHYYLAEMYSQGLGVEQSCTTAAALYKNVAERGDWLHSPFPEAHKAYTSGDKESALIYYLLAAERGYEIGQSNVAWLLDRDKSMWHLTHSTPEFDPIQDKLALIYWTRSANQGNVDSRVKMGDYYFKGFGTEADYEKAAACYQVAAEIDFSAMAMWNIGWMYENGIGFPKDFNLAKRWYDKSLEANPYAYLPVTLSLKKLSLKSFWEYIAGYSIGGSEGGSGVDDHEKKIWRDESMIGSEKDETGGSIEQIRSMTKESASPKQGRKEWDIIGPDGEKLLEKYNARKNGEEDLEDSLGLPDKDSEQD